MQPKITVYTTFTCPICQMVKNFLENMNLEYKEIHVGINPVQMVKLIGKTKQLTVPQVNIDGEWVSGFNPVRMLQIIGKSQKEKPLLVTE